MLKNRLALIPLILFMMGGISTNVVVENPPFKGEVKEEVLEIQDHLEEEALKKPITEVEEKTVDLTFVGDVTFVNPLERNSKKYGYNYPWAHVSHYFQDDDISLINLETPISLRGTPLFWKEFTYQSSPQNVQEMKKASIEYASLANNHLLDYGRDAFVDTLAYLKEAGIKYSGGGSNYKEAIRPAVFEVDGKKLGIISYSRVVPKIDWYATDKRPGIVGAYDSQLNGVIEKVREYDGEFDLLVVSIHWGQMYEDYPRKEEEIAARKLVDAGADLIIGHHPHCIQGVEIYKGKPIFYSMGNFIFPNLGQNADTSFIGKASFNGENFTKIEMIPCKIQGGRPIPMEGEEKERELIRLNKLSKPYGSVFKNGVLTGQDQ